ncbi:MAG TPA: transcriptional regulator [Ruminococcaceae bacterium]|nr:transcriptional regulator [Oscillospiraceae bacterium]
MNTNERLQKIINERGWTYYRLSKNSGLSESTVTNIFKRNTVPSIPTLELICKGFGITLSQFFADGDMVELTSDLKRIFDGWSNLTPKQKQAVLQVIDAMKNDSE